MKKLLLVPAVVAVAAISSASAAGFVGGVSASPLQTGQTSDLTCADSARVVEWGFRDDLAVPTVDTARIQLTNSDCGGQAIHLIQQSSTGSQIARAVAARIDDTQAAGTQYARVVFTPAIPAAALDNVRISIDPGWSTLTNIASIN